jgi:hypothetical protein
LPHDGKRYDPRRPVDFPADAMVDLSPPLREFLLKKVFHFEEKEDGYTYKEIRGHLRWYLNEHRNTIVNYRNRAICNIKNDPLRRVFLCQAFYRGQVQYSSYPGQNPYDGYLITTYSHTLFNPTILYSIFSGELLSCMYSTADSYSCTFDKLPYRL